MLDELVKALKSIFKGPVPERRQKSRAKKKAKSALSTSHTRYSAHVPAKVPELKKAVAKKTVVKSRLTKPRIKKIPVSEKASPKIVSKKKEAVAKIKKPPQEFYVGEITHYFSKISVVVVKVEEHPILIQDTIIVRGSAEFSQKVQSLQVESKDVRFARKGELVGLQVIEPAKPGDKVYKIKK